jgi:hypothetical protein
MTRRRGSFRVIRVIRGFLTLEFGLFRRRPNPEYELAGRQEEIKIKSKSKIKIKNQKALHKKSGTSA